MRRQTPQRNAVARVFRTHRRPLSAEEVRRLASRSSRRLGIATVYRHIKSLLAEGWLVPVPLPGATCRYERANLAHHHHFHCQRCGRVFDLRGCTAGLKALLPRGFRPRGHEIIFRGLCPSCWRAA